MARRLTTTVLQVVLVVLAVAGALWLIYRLRSLILLLILSAFFAYLINPLVEVARRPFPFRGRERQVSTAVAIAVVYLVLFGAVTVMLAWLVPRFSQQVTQISGQAPVYMKAVQEHAQKLTAVYDRFGLPQNARQEIERALATLGGSIEAGARRWLMTIVGLFAYLPWLVLIPILAFFLLKDGQAFRRNALTTLPAGRWRSYGVQLFDRVDEALAAYIRAQLLACLIVGTVVGIGFTLLGVPYPVILGVVAGLAEFIPLVGPVIVAVVAALIAALQAPILALWVLVFLGVLRITEDYVVYPRLVGHTIDLHPLAIILAVLAGAELAGVIGVFLSVPVLAVLSAAYRQYLASTGGRGLVAELLQPSRAEVATDATPPRAAS
jgi:predicted PurR-regulated permease PerM